MLSEAELERRKPVWTAFSEFWLDTELDGEDLKRIARVAAASSYTIAELRDIYRYEIAAVVRANLYCVVGVWEGFDEEWLHGEARKRAAKRSLMQRQLYATRLGEAWMTSGADRHWKQIVSILDGSREAATTKFPS